LPKIRIDCLAARRKISASRRSTWGVAAVSCCPVALVARPGFLFFWRVDMSGSKVVRHVVRVVTDVVIEDEGVGASPLTPALARELAAGYESRPWLASIGDLRWVTGTPTVISASVVEPSPVVVESDTEDMGMGEPASVPPAAQK
jgi:hypothetical protein